MSNASNIVVQTEGSEVVSDRDGVFSQVSEKSELEEREPPVQVLLLPSPAGPMPGIFENGSQSALGDFSESKNVCSEPPLFVPGKWLATASFRALQMYEGTVQEVNASSFVANLIDKSSPGEPEQVATIEFDHVWESDFVLVKPGAVFYWSVGYRTEPHGQRSLVSNIRFRRLPAWTNSDLKKAKEYAAGLNELFASD